MNSTPNTSPVAQDAAAQLADTEQQLTDATNRIQRLQAEMEFWRASAVQLALDVQDMRAELGKHGVTHQSHLFLVPAV